MRDAPKLDLANQLVQGFGFVGHIVQPTDGSYDTDKECREAVPSEDAVF